MDGVFCRQNIKLSLPSTDKETAIVAAGKVLVAAGYVEEGYIATMLEREKQVSVYMGSGLAVPHGTLAGRGFVKQSGIVVLQYPDGVLFGDEKAYLLVALACTDGGQLEILQNIADVFLDLEPEEIQALFVTDNVDLVYDTFK